MFSFEFISSPIFDWLSRLFYAITGAIQDRFDDMIAQMIYPFRAIGRSLFSRISRLQAKH